MSRRGLDVSKFQGLVDWNQVKAAGYQFAMIRAGYGFGTVDEQFRRNISECNRLGIPAGAYWFCYATSPEVAVREAEGCLRTIKGYRLEYPVCYDIEQVSADYAAGLGVTYTRELVQSLIRAFCDRIEAEGYFAMYYSNKNFIDNYIGSQLSERYALWYARYNNTFDGTRCGIWQYSNMGRIPGITGNADLDEGFVDYPAIIKKAGLNHLDETPAPPAPPSPEPTYITYIIQPGDTLSEIALQFGTTVEVLAELNGIKNPNLIYAGERLRIPERDGEGRYYTVRPGDTLSGIALMFGTTVSALVALNGIKDPNLIYPGQRILIP